VSGTVDPLLRGRAAPGSLPRPDPQPQPVAPRSALAWCSRLAGMSPTSCRKCRNSPEGL